MFSYIWLDLRAAEPYRPHVEGRIAALSFQSVGELLFGAFKRGWGDRRFDALRAEIERYLVIEPNRDLAEHWARVRAEREGAVRTIAVAYALIDATAIWMAAPLVTNDRNIAGIDGLTVITEKMA